MHMHTIDPVLEGPCDERAPSGLRPLGQNFLCSFITNVAYDLRPPAFCDHFDCAREVASQDRFICTTFLIIHNSKNTC